MMLQETLGHYLNWISECSGCSFQHRNYEDFVGSMEQDKQMRAERGSHESCDQWCVILHDEDSSAHVSHQEYESNSLGLIMFVLVCRKMGHLCIFVLSSADTSIAGFGLQLPIGHSSLLERQICVLVRTHAHFHMMLMVLFLGRVTANAPDC